MFLQHTCTTLKQASLFSSQTAQLQNKQSSLTNSETHEIMQEWDLDYEVNIIILNTTLLSILNLNRQYWI